MSDERNEDIETELVILKPGEEEPEDKKPEVIDPEEYKRIQAENATLKSQADPVGAITRGLDNLGNVLNRPAPQQQQAPAKPVELESMYPQLEEELFKPGQTGPVLRKFTEEIVNRVIQSQIGSQIDTLIGYSVAETKNNLKRDGRTKEIFNAYEQEIESLVAGSPAEIRKRPDVYKLAVDEVSRRHADEIREKEINEEVQRRMAEQGKGTQQQATLHDSGGVSLGNANGTPQKKRVYVKITEEDRMKAEWSGLEPEQVAELRVKRERGEL